MDFLLSKVVCLRTRDYKKAINTKNLTQQDCYVLKVVSQIVLIIKLYFTSKPDAHCFHTYNHTQAHSNWLFTVAKTQLCFCTVFYY